MPPTAWNKELAASSTAEPMAPTASPMASNVKQARVQLLEQGAGFLIRLELRSVLRAFEGGHGGRLVKTHLEVLDGPHLDGVAWQLRLRDVAAEFN